MLQLILIDQRTKQELARQDMTEALRYEYYRACFDHELITVYGRRYRALAGVWQIPQHDFVMQVIFDSWDVPTPS